MARKKRCTKYKATTACTVRLCDKLGMNESNMDIQPRRRVYADSWFASVDTALALRDQLGVHFTGPIKTVTRGFPIQAMRWTLASKNRGDHIVLKSKDYPYLYAIGWHDVHYKCFVTTNWTTLPGAAALKNARTNTVKITISIFLALLLLQSTNRRWDGWTDTIALDKAFYICLVSGLQDAGKPAFSSKFLALLWLILFLHAKQLCLNGARREMKRVFLEICCLPDSSD